MPRLDDTAVQEGLQHLPGWERRGNQIVKTFVRADFAQAMVFVNEIASAVEAAGHHPDIDIRWNKVTLALSSHAEGGLTDRGHLRAVAYRMLGWLSEADDAVPEAWLRLRPPWSPRSCPVPPGSRSASSGRPAASQAPAWSWRWRRRGTRSS
jgi:4a-hydroxytetrahydrobiopterin dehydratase